MSIIPLIDISPLVKDSVTCTTDKQAVNEAIQQIHRACRDVGFFYITGHGVEQSTVEQIFSSAKRFFALPEETKNLISIHNSASYSGYIAKNSEKTNNVIDIREGIYFGQQSSVDDLDQFPDEENVPGFADCVTTYTNIITNLGFIMMRALAVGLGLKDDYFDEKFARPSLITLALMHYPPHPDDSPSCGVGVHTDYGMFTFVLQDDIGGLEAEIGGEWVEVKPIPGTFVINLGDCLEAWTKGLYRATRHKVRRSITKDRYSVILFFNPKATCAVEPLETSMTKDLCFKTSVKGIKMPFYFGDLAKSLLNKSHGWSKEKQTKQL